MDDASQRASLVQVMAFDVDGVMTDGTIFVSAGGETIKAFHSLDGHGIKMLSDNGIVPALITGRTSESVAWRARELGIAHVYQGTSDKREAFADLLSRTGHAPNAAGYMGDDLPDLCIISRSGFSATVAHAPQALKSAADFVATMPAGAGAVREVCEFILAAKGLLETTIEAYRK